MIYLVFFVIVLANISSNGRASMQNSISNRNYSFAHLHPTPANFDMACYRPCKLKNEPHRCMYKFHVKPAIIADGKEAIVINGITPGPPIHVCLNDIVIVEVKNEVPGQEITIHWSGIDQKVTPFMDGVPMVTQCPIQFGATYRYAFIASKPGTYFYHADAVTQQIDGVYGALVVNQPTPLDPHASLYDYDRSLDNTLIVGVRFLKLLTGNLEDNSKKRPKHLLINGDEDLTKIYVLPGFKYKLRLINGIGLECPVRLRIEQHVMTVIATDSRAVKPFSANIVLLHPGERMDVVVSASQVKGGYWIKVDGTAGVCAGLKADAMFLYSGFEYPDLLNARQIGDNTKNVSSTVVSGQMLESLYDINYSPVKETIYLGIDKNIVRMNASDVDFHYILGALHGRPYFPAALLTLKETGLIQINNKNFLYPRFPLLLYPQEIGASVNCEVGKEHEVEDTQCVHILSAKNGEWIEMVLVNEGHRNNDSYTFHMHGRSMVVLETWSKSDGNPLTKEEYFARDSMSHKNVKNSRVLTNPVVKDTISVPNKGYVLVRFRAHPGSWMLECRACSLLLPTAIVIHVPINLPKKFLNSLPTCGTFKPPDVLLN